MTMRTSAPKPPTGSPPCPAYRPACQGAHGVLAARGQWITNEKALIGKAGLREVDAILTGLTAEPGRLLASIDAAAALVQAALAA